jgi:hypothetical protein
MKTPHVIKCIVNLLKPLVAAVCALLAMVVPAKAATYWWDVVSGDGATITDGSSAVNWETDLFWNDGLGWANGNDAVFGGGSSGTAGTVTIGATVAPTSITFNQPFLGNYTLNGGTISLGSAATDITNNARGTTTINSNIVLTDDQVWTTGLGATLALVPRWPWAALSSMEGTFGQIASWRKRASAPSGSNSRGPQTPWATSGIRPARWI